MMSPYFGTSGGGFYGDWSGGPYDPSVGGFGTGGYGDASYPGLGGYGGVDVGGGGIGGGYGNSFNPDSLKPYLPYILAGGAALGGALGGGGSQIQPQVAPDKFPELKQNINDLLKGQFDPATGQMKPLPGYTGQINNPMSPMQQQVANSWQPWDAGTQYLASYLANPNKGQSQQMGGYQNNVMQYGAPSQYTGNLMNNMVAYGGAGDWTTQNMHNLAQFGMATPTSPGGWGLLQAMQTGAPSAGAGGMVQNMAANGITGQAGMPLLNRAQGSVNPMLAQFMGAQPYQSPNIRYQPTPRFTGGWR